MNITKREIDDLNAVLTVEISKEDYADKVEGILKNYRKTANIPGFRKGQVPMGMVKKQYGRAVLVEEVNKLIQNAIQEFLADEKLNILGYPVPVNEDEINWNDENYKFEFELGLAPQFEIDLKANEVVQYKIIADDKVLDDQVERIRRQYGKMISKSEIGENDRVTGKFTNASENEDEPKIEHETVFEMSVIHGEEQKKALLGATQGQIIELKTLGLFEDEHLNQRYLGVEHDDAHGLDIVVDFEVQEIVEMELADLSQEFFDKVFGEGEVTSEEEMKKKLKEGMEARYNQDSDQKLLDDVVESLISNTKFELPEDFLQKWIARAGEKRLSEEEAKAEYEKSEKGIRYQLIEGKLRAENNLNVTFNEMKEYAKSLLRAQMAQYGQTNPEEEELDAIAARVLANREEVERLTEQLQTSKLLQFFKENAKLKTKELNYREFVEEVYG
ncbi:MAG TPA: trigger factor [Flavobacteriaceae bacterium]|nr:trigger factor [Flavobacteriaceae bacterium]